MTKPKLYTDETPLYIALVEFFKNNPNYKITSDEFVELVSILSREVLK